MTAPVNDSTSPMTDIHDIKPALAFGAQWPWWVWLVIVLGLAALAALTWWLRRQRQKDTDTATSDPMLPPDVEAFQQLDRLAARGNDNPKLFYFSLSAILRRYVERRYDFPAAEMTTEELLPQIQRLDLADALADEVKHFCRNSDPIKFADAPSSQANTSKDLAFVRQFVEQTTQAAVEDIEGDQSSATHSPAPLQKQLPQPNPLPERSPNTKHQTQNTKN